MIKTNGNSVVCAHVGTIFAHTIIVAAVQAGMRHGATVVNESFRTLSSSSARAMSDVGGHHTDV